MNAAAPRFSVVGRRTLAQEVRDRLLEAIRLGSLPPGTALPSERELCEDFGVARTSVREAIQGLFALGLLERRGNRTYVSEDRADVPLDGADHRKLEVRELFEVREAMEAAIARLVVERATPQQRAEIASIASRFRGNMPLDEFRALDKTFHWSLARACGNELLADLYGKVLERLFQSQDFGRMLSARINRPAVRTLVREACRDHKAIAAALLNGQGATVVGAVEGHVKQVQDHMIGHLV